MNRDNFHSENSVKEELFKLCRENVKIREGRGFGLHVYFEIIIGFLQVTSDIFCLFVYILRTLTVNPNCTFWLNCTHAYFECIAYSKDHYHYGRSNKQTNWCGGVVEFELPRLYLQRLVRRAGTNYRNGESLVW